MKTKEMKNAKELLYDIVEEKNLQILAINCSYDFSFYKSQRYTEQGEITRLEDFDTDPYNYPYGVVYCKDKTTGEPIWLTAEEYDSICFWWEIRRFPAFYDKLYEVKEINSEQ